MSESHGRASLSERTCLLREIRPDAQPPADLGHANATLEVTSRFQPRSDNANRSLRRRQLTATRAIMATHLSRVTQEGRNMERWRAMLSRGFAVLCFLAWAGCKP